MKIRLITSNEVDGIIFAAFLNQSQVLSALEDPIYSTAVLLYFLLICHKWEVHFSGML